MTTSTSEILLSSVVAASATRENGKAARDTIIAELRATDVVAVDLSGVSLTPSFADECFGMLAAELGWEEFRERVKLRNVPDSARPLVKHVVSRRIQERATAAA